MNTVYHILGADIPHHNHTVLGFFAKELLPRLDGSAYRFWVVGQDDFSAQFPSLKMRQFDSQKAVAQAVITQAKADKQAQFVLHGQFNLALWLAILRGKLPACRCHWHVWGADLYQDSKAWKFRLFYPLRRLAQKKLGAIWATAGDLHYAQQLLKRNNAKDQVIYFPTKMNPDLAVPLKTEHAQLTILLGNSGDRSNRHLEALAQIKASLGEQVKVIVPMGYPENNQAYIALVKQCAAQLFPAGAVEVLEQKIAFEQYLDILAGCDIGYFIFERQQGIGTICLLTQFDIPIVIHPNNPFAQDLQAANVPFMFSHEVSPARAQQAQHALHTLDKRQIPFFYPNYIEQWVKVLSTLTA